VQAIEGSTLHVKVHAIPNSGDWLETGGGGGGGGGSGSSGGSSSSSSSSSSSRASA
jgi:hypothetical protein